MKRMRTSRSELQPIFGWVWRVTTKNSLLRQSHRKKSQEITMNKTSTAAETMSYAFQLPAPSTAARPTLALTAAHDTFEEGVNRLPQCDASSVSTLRLPRLRRCRYPPRFYKHAAMTTSKINSTLILALLSASSLLVAADQGDFTGQWNGEWQANSNGQYSHYYDDDGVAADDEHRVYHMWWVPSCFSCQENWIIRHMQLHSSTFTSNRKDDNDETMSPERFMLYAAISILSTMVFLFCLCHPECVMLLFARFRSCYCGSNKGEMENGAANTEYVGGIQMEKKGGNEREMVWCKRWWWQIFSGGDPLFSKMCLKACVCFLTLFQVRVDYYLLLRLF